jgi:hypothetical protein
MLLLACCPIVKPKCAQGPNGTGLLYSGKLFVPLQVQPDARFESPSLCRALFEIFLGEKPIIPDAIGRWAEGTKKLLDSENDRRSTRRGGSA